MKYIFTRRFLLLLTLLPMAIGAYADAWYYSKVIATAVPTGAGSVYVAAVDYTNPTPQQGVSNVATQYVEDEQDGHKYCLTAYTNAGYVFSGWYTDQYNGSCTSSSAQYIESFNGNTSEDENNPTPHYRYARFTPATYYIYFYQKVGDNSAWRTASVQYTATYGSCSGGWQSPNRTGYTFTGWYKSDGTTKVESSHQYTNTSNIALYGHWNPNQYTITLNNQSATSAGTQSITATFDANTNLTGGITIPSKTDHVFEGYYTATGGGGTQIINASGQVVASASGAGQTYTDASRNWKYAGNITLYAKWTHIETPVFKLNGTAIAENGEVDAELNLLVGQTATITFEHIGSTFQFPSGTDQVSYTHSTGVIEALAAGSATLTFNQPLETYIYAHTRSLKVNVSKHTVTLTTTLNNTEFDVFTAFNIGDIYTLTTPAGPGEPAQNEITISSSNTNAFAFENGQWRAVGAGTATLTIAQAANDYWTGDTITATIQVNKIDPSITPVISAATITYGQSMSASAITGTVTIATPVDTEDAASTCTWKTPTDILSAGEHTATVVFQSEHTNWFNPVEIANVPIMVEKTDPTVAATRTLIYGQLLSEVGFTNATIGVRAEDGIISGEINWKEAVNEDVLLTEGEYNYAVTFTSTNNNYKNGEGTCIVTVTPGFVFKGDESNDWNDADNWLEDNTPATGERATVDADVEVTGDVTVAGLTINAGKTLTVKEGATLTIGDDNSLIREAYGDIVFESGGKLVLEGGTLTVNDFTMHSGFDSQHQPESGQLVSQEHLTANGIAYFVLDLDPSGEASYGWYDFSVPFPVDALHGITRWNTVENKWEAITNEVNYAIMAYHEDLRAQGKNGWKKYKGILNPGQLYTITTDTTFNSYRFERLGTGAFDEAANTQSLEFTDSGNSNDHGWNGLGNGTLRYITIDEAPVVQIFNHQVYVPTSLAGKALAVGSAYFYQTHAANSHLTLSAADGNSSIIRAPQRASAEGVQRFAVALSTAGSLCDRIFITCDDNATADYTIGKDIEKMGETDGKKGARIWTNAKGTKLCAIHTAYDNNQAVIPLQLSAPANAEYTLSLEDYPAEDVYLTRDGVIVGDLGISDYMFDLNAGTDSSYALLVVRRVHDTATSVDENHDNNHSDADIVKKMIVNGQLFILHDGTLYNAQGEEVSFK